MKFSYQWLSEMVEGLDTPAKDLARLITLKTAECEGVEETGALLEGAAEALVVAVEPMGQSHNRKATVETMRYGQKHVVCGAPNCRVGLRTVYVPLGKKIIEGVESDGMLASAAELGISRDHSGIVELDGPFTLTPDFVIEVDNKSLTHRPDLWGHHGMAREVAAILGRPLRDPVKPIAFPDAPPAIEVTIDDFALCPRYSALVFENVKVQPSPLWLLYRLEAIGLEPHLQHRRRDQFHPGRTPATDARLRRRQTARRNRGPRGARGRTHTAALKFGETYDLDPSNLLITDSSGPIAIAGVIGGADHRHLRHHHQYRFRKRLLQRVERPQDQFAPEASHRRVDALRESAGPRQHRPRAAPCARTAGTGFPWHPIGRRPRRHLSSARGASSDRTPARLARSQTRPSHPRS